MRWREGLIIIREDNGVGEGGERGISLQKTRSIVLTNIIFLCFKRMYLKLNDIIIFLIAALITGAQHHTLYTFAFISFCVLEYVMR